MKSGFIAIVGLPNVGKSSLLNAMLKQKVSIVSPKPQTTRESIRGILTTEDCQMIFLDTPGHFKPRNSLGKYMTKNISQAAKDADVILLVIDGQFGIKRQDMELVEQYRGREIPLIVAINKIDKTTYEYLYPELAKLNDLSGIAEIIPLSALTDKNVAVLVDLLKKYMPDGPLYYDAELITDVSERYLCGEILREKALLFVHDEIPHGMGVNIVAMKDEGKIVRIDAELYVERDSHKLIVIGSKGEMLKRIATSARVDIERLIDKKVMLEIFVKVREDWRNDTLIMNDLGYNDKK